MASIKRRVRYTADILSGHYPPLFTASIHKNDPEGFEEDKQI